MSRILIRQAQFVPLAALLAIVVTGAVMPGYSSVSQHMSELGVLDHPVARVLHVYAMVTGMSVVLFGIGLKMRQPRGFGFTALAAVTFGTAIFASGIYHTGSPMHGLYGLTMFYVLVPAFFAAELPGHLRSPLIVKTCLLGALMSLCYMWFLYSGLEPHGFRGITQRVGSLIIFGWYAIASHWLLRARVRPSDKAVSDIATAGV